MSKPRVIWKSHGLLLMCDVQADMPMCEIEAAYTKDKGPHVVLYRIMQAGEREHCLTFGWLEARALVRWIPLVLTAAKRLESRANSRHSNAVEQPS